MKRAIVLQVRSSVDNNTQENLAWVTVGCIPSKMKDGRLYSPKTTDILITTVAGEVRSPDKFKKYKNLKIGSLVDVVMALNEYNNKLFVEDILTVADSVYTDDDLYGKRK